MDRLRNLVYVAAGMDAKRGDRLEVNAIKSALSPSAAQQPVALSNTSATSEKQSSTSFSFMMSHTITALIFLLIGWALSAFINSKPKKLDTNEREIALRKLRIWLSEDQGRV
jgi:flagellar biosynthesis/type III secretory pathway M-ring protein FliF/YscJ